MKTKSIILSMLFAVSAIVSASAAGPDDTGVAVIHAQGSKVVRVVYKGENTGRVKVNLYDASASLIFSETFVNMEAFILPLNLTGLAAGEYTVELVDAKGTSVKTISYEPASSLKYVRVNKIDENSGKFLLSVVGTKNADDQIRVKIYNGDTLIYNEAKDINGEYAEVYSVRSALGPLTFQITDNEGKTTSASF